MCIKQFRSQYINKQIIATTYLHITEHMLLSTVQDVWSKGSMKWDKYLMFCWPCIIMYHNNVTNLIHLSVLSWLRYYEINIFKLNLIILILFCYWE
jgi:hypothetical protein